MARIQCTCTYICAQILCMVFAMLTQRLGSASQKDDAFIDGLIKIIKENPGCCDEVWFATDYGFPPISVHVQTAQTIKKQSEKFAAAGVRVALQISNTIGHGHYMAKCDCTGLLYQGSPVENMVGPDGTVAGYCFCWRGENFINYTIKMVQAYAPLKPYSFWIDDDLRPQNHAPINDGCFCDNCINAFNAMHDSSFSREQLVHEINFGSLEWRARYIAFLRQGIYDFTYKLCAAMHALSPDSFMGLQLAGFGYYLGRDSENCVYDAMKAATGKNPLSRPGGGSYNDHDPQDFTRKGYYLAKLNSTLPEYVSEIRPEIENLPDVIYGKSIPGTCFETSFYFALGSTAMSYAMVMNDFESFTWHGQMLESFAAHREYWQAMAEINKSTVQGGVTAACSKDAWQRKCETPFEYADDQGTKEARLRYINLPIAYTREGGWVFILHGDNAGIFSDAEITDLLSKPVLTDAQTLDVLTRRGFKFGAAARHIEVVELTEEYAFHPVNKGMEGHGWDGKFPSYNGGWRIDDLDGTTECIGRYRGVHSTTQNHGQIANAIVRTQGGAKWAVYGFDLWNRTVSTEKRDQIINAVEYISQPLPAKLITPIQAVLLPRLYKEGGGLACVSVTNCTIGHSGALELWVDNPAGTCGIYMSQYSPKTQVVVDDSGRVVIPDIAPWSVGTVFFD